jgi:hypothetical protein
MMRVNVVQCDGKLKTTIVPSSAFKKLKWRTSLSIFFKKFAPKCFSKFAFSSSRGVLSGILIGWNDCVLRNNSGN